MILAFALARKRPLHLREVEELQELALAEIREIKYFSGLSRSLTVDRRLEKHRARFNLIDMILATRGGLLITKIPGRRWAFELVPILNAAEEAALDAALDELEGAPSRINWAGLQANGGER